MARFTRNAVEGTSDEARSGWRARRDRARAKRGAREMSRAEIAAIRRAHAGAAQAADEIGFNPEVKGSDYVSQLSDADLAGLYKQLHDGRAPPPKAKRPTLERAVRAKQAETAGVTGTSGAITGQGALATLSMLADDADPTKIIEGDEQ